MKTITAKEFAIQQLAPYYNNNKECGYNAEDNECVYLTKDGKMCVAGKNFKKSILESFKSCSMSIEHVLDERGQEYILKPEAVNILSNTQWRKMQNIHDYIAKNNHGGMLDSIESLNLFSIDELKEYKQ